MTARRLQPTMQELKADVRAWKTLAHMLLAIVNDEQRRRHIMGPRRKKKARGGK